MTPHVYNLADLPSLIPAVGLLRWREWATADEDPASWVETAAAETGRDGLPFTLVALGDDDALLGAVALGQFEYADLREQTPWVMGMVVEPALRGRRIGSLLLASLEARAVELGYRELWVATDGAEGFYQRWGWRYVETVDVAGEGPMAVLTKALTPPTGP